MVDPATTTQEISQFIISCLPLPDSATSVKTFNYTEYLVNAKQCGNADFVAAANEEIRMLKEAIEN